MHCQRKENTVLYSALQRHNTENSKQIFPEKELHGLSPIKDKVRKLCWTGQKWKKELLERTEVEDKAVGVDRSGMKAVGEESIVENRIMIEGDICSRGR
jgi:hypothetical protein